MTAPLICPYCNSTVSVPTDTRAGQRVVCSRCGDPFTATWSSSDGGAAFDPDVASSFETGTPRRTRSNRAVAAIILAVMGCMAAVGLAYALLTVKDRRAIDTGISGKARRAPPARPEPLESLPLAAAPDQLEGLGFLPADTALIVTADVGELRSSRVASRLLTEGFRVGALGVRPESVIAWTGLRPQEIDHIVLGVRLDDSIPPRLWLIAHTNDAMDADRLSVRLKAQRIPSTQQRTIYRYSVPGLSLPLNFTCLNDRTVVVSLLPSYLTDIPTTPYANVSQLASELRNVIQNRHEVGAALWLAAHSKTWPRILGRPLLEGMKKHELECLKQIKTAGLWVLPLASGGLKIRGDFHCADRSAATALDELLQRPHRADNISVKTVLDGAWVNLQVQADLTTLQEVLTGLP